MLVSKTDKTIKKMASNPRDWRIDQLETIAKSFNINVRKTGGSHVVFEHPQWIELLTVPAKRPIKPFYVKKFITLLELLGDKNEHN